MIRTIFSTTFSTTQIHYKLFLPSEIHASISVSFIANIASGAKKFNDEDSDPEGVLFYE